MNFLAVILQSQPTTTAAQEAALMIMPIFLLIGIVFLVICIIPFWFICKKAGFSPWLALINVVPFGTLILLYVLAFAQWKVALAPQPGWPQPYPPQPPYSPPPQA